MMLPPPYAPIRHGSSLSEGQPFVLDATAMSGLAFRQIHEKEAFTIVDAGGCFFRATLKSARGEHGEALAYERLRVSPESPARITLVCAVLARQRMILVSQKAAELGCVSIAPVLSERSVSRDALEHEKPWAWQGQAIKGARQCRRASVPRVLPVEPLDRVLQAPFWTGASLRVVLDDRAASSTDPFPPAHVAPIERDVAFAVGPEGGWSEAERARLTREGAHVLALGARVLRAETAVFAGLSILQHRLGDLRA